MIVTRLVGGLGNQVFQYAAGRSLAARLGAELVLDSSWIEGAGGAGPGSARSYRLGCFALPYEPVPAQRVARVPAQTRIEYHLQRLLPSRRPKLTALVEERGGELDGRFFTARDDTLLLGFWESERYFAEHVALIRSELRFAAEPGPALAAEIGERASVSLHVRRGDKLTTAAAAAKHVSLEPSWYAAALETLARRAGSLDTAYVFSDDPEWCRDHLELPLPTVVVDGHADHEDLRLMSLCRHHVIANSTFGWWGAWLDPRPDSVVVAPATWRLDRPTPDAVPGRWIQVEN
jgi:hypothetical protein